MILKWGVDTPLRTMSFWENITKEEVNFWNIFSEYWKERMTWNELTAYSIPTVKMQSPWGLRPEVCNFIEKRDSGTGVLGEFWEICKKNFFTEHLWWLLIEHLWWLRLAEFFLFPINSYYFQSTGVVFASF